MCLVPWECSVLLGSTVLNCHFVGVSTGLLYGDRIVGNSVCVTKKPYILQVIKAKALKLQQQPHEIAKHVIEASGRRGKYV